MDNIIDFLIDLSPLLLTLTACSFAKYVLGQHIDFVETFTLLLITRIYINQPKKS